MTPYSCELQIAQKVWPEIVSQKIVQEGSDLPRTIRTAISIGSGCALAVAKLASNLLRDRYSCCVNAATPYEVVHSPVVPDAAVLLSAKGEHKHVLSCFESLQRRGVHTVVITARRSSPLIELASRALGTTTVISTTRTVSDGGFIPVESTLVLADLISKALEKQTSNTRLLFDSAVSHHERFTEGPAVSAGTEKYHVVASTWATPAGVDFETRMTEAGLCTPSLTDPWNFAHGRYMPLFQGRREAVIMMSVKGEELEMERIARICGDSFQYGIIVAPDSQYAGAIYCMVRSMLLVGHICSSKGIDPASPAIPESGNALYEARDLT